MSDKVSSKGMLGGLKDRSAKDCDASMRPGLSGGNGSVNAEPTRSQVGVQPPTIGPRCA